MVAFLNWFGDPNNLIAVSTFIIAAVRRQNNWDC
jgi:hypothetical protein